MLTETLEAGLAEYRIGSKVRAYRKRKNLGLAELSAHTGLSTAMLSKIERGKLFPTLPTLLRIAMVFGVGLEHFFIDDEKKTVAITRRNDRIKLPDRQGNSSPSFVFESLNYPLNERGFEAYLAEFSPGGPPTEPHSHDGTELVYVSNGQLSVTIEGVEHILDAGDAICFDPSAKHSYRCVGRRSTHVLVTVTL